MTTREAGIYLKMHRNAVAKAIREGRIQATRRRVGQLNSAIDVTQEALDAYATSRTTRSQRATELWAKRKRIGFPVGQIASNDEVADHERRVSASRGDPHAQEATQEQYHLTRWWNAVKGDIIGTTTEYERHAYEQQILTARPIVVMVPYHPSVG